MRIVGRVVPLVGTGLPSSCGVGVAEGDADGVAVGVGARVADGVASPKTCVPLLSIVKVLVNAMGFPRSSTVVAVTLCLPVPRGLVGV